jgi:hypothetical protein
MGLTLAKVEEIAPDQGSLDAARKLLKPQGWPSLGCDGDGLIWGECQGSGSQPYRTIASEADFGTKCTCPSRKFPCKHALALLWMRADGRTFQPQERPQWVNDWLARRRPGGGAAKPAAAAGERKDIGAAAEPEAPPDPAAEARAAAQRERNRLDRETMILAGLDELDRWLIDHLERGLAGFQSVAQEQCRLLARRLVDAKASGLAGRVEQLPAALFAQPEPQRPEFLVEKLAELHLIAESYRRQAELPPALRADVRQTVGWTLGKDALVGEPEALRIRDRFMVVATVNEVQPDKLRRLECWLARLGEGEGPRFAVLIDFMPVSLGSVGNPHAPGEEFFAELLFFPSAAPLRAVIMEKSASSPRPERWPVPAHGVAGALADYEATLARQPWLGTWPMAVANATLARQGDDLVLTEGPEGACLPLAPDPDDLALPLLGVNGIDVFGLWDGRRLALKLAETPLGRWVAA